MQYNRLTSESAIIDYIKRLEKDVKRLANRGSGTIIITDPNTGVETIIGELPDGTTGIQPFVGDTEPPPVATIPIVNSGPGVISITWDGLFTNNATKPNDFTHLNIIGHKLDGVNTVSSAVIGKISSTDVFVYFSQDTIPVGETWNFSFESEDYNGNKSLESARSTSVSMQSLATDTAVDLALQDLQADTIAAQTTADNAQIAANNAQTAADNAAADAATAAGIANSKGKVLTQSTQPSVSDQNSNTLWIDTTNGTNTPKRWDGSTWIAVTDKIATDAAAAAATAQTRADQAYNEAISAATAAGNAQTTADGKNRVWYQTTAPAGTAHKTGDTWFDTDDGNKIYLWTGSAWTVFQDAAIATAQSTANSAQTAANGKNTNYYQTSAPTGGTYKVGDTWFDTDDNYKMYSWSGTAWQLVQDSATALSTANTKNRTFIQSTAPTASATGDLWIDTANGNQIKRWSGSAWVDARDTTIATAQSTANNALTSANGKNRIFYQTAAPTGTFIVGDTWFDTDDGNKIYVWNGSAWTASQDAGIAAAQSTANTANSTANSALSTANSKIKTYFQPNQPGTTGNTTGDIWFDTDDGNKVYVWNGTAWTVAQDTAIAAAQTSANGKNKNYYQTTQPSGGTYLTGDLWFDTDDNYKMYTYNGSAWVVTQDSAGAIVSAEKYSQSRGMDLVTNGNGQLLSNKNFSPFTYDQTDTPTGAVGVFDYPIGASLMLSDELMRVDPAKSYQLRVTAKQKTAGVITAAYTGLAPYDPLGLAISPTFYMEQANTRTTLAAALNPGDTTITLTSAANWNNAGGATATHLRSMIVWNYVDAAGKLWAPGTYSRNYYGDLWNEGAISGNVITLKAPWAGPAIPSGTTVGNGSSGGTYMYVAMSNTTVPQTWTSYSGSVAGVHTDLTVSATTKFPVATASVKLVFLGNRAVGSNPTTGSKHSFANISFSEVSAANLEVGGITDTLIASNAVTTAKIADLAITDAKIATATISSAKISSLDAGKITTGTLDANRIGANTLTATHIASNAITSDELAANSITAAKGQISDAAITTAKIADAQITNAKIADLSITNAKIVDGTIQNAKIGNLDAAKITSGIIDANRIGANSITANKILVGDFTNLASDGNFTDTTKKSWTGSGTVVTEANAPNKLKVVTAASGNNDQPNVNTFQVTAGEQIYGEVWVYGETTNVGGGSANLHLAVTLNDGTITWPYFNSATRAAVSGQWIKLSGKVTIPSNAKTAKVEPAVSFSSDAVGNTYYFREVSVRRMATGSLIVDGAIQAGSAIIADGAIGTAKIGDAQITTAKIADLAVTDAKIDTISAGKITAGFLDAARIAAGTIGTSHLSAGNIDASVLTAGSISGSKIAAKAITTDKLVITSTDNLIVEANFGNNGSSWQLGPNKTINATAGRGSLPAFRVTGSAVQETSLNLVNKIPVGTEDRFRCSMWVKSTVALAIDKVRLMVRCYTTATAYTDIIGVYNKVDFVANTWTNLSDITPALPAGTVAVEFYIAVTNDATATITDIDYVAVTRAADGKLIVDGAINGKTITGAIIQTAETGARIVLDSSGLRGWDANDKNYLTADSTGIVVSGTLNATGIVEDPNTLQILTETLSLGGAVGMIPAATQQYPPPKPGGNSPGMAFKLGPNDPSMWLPPQITSVDGKRMTIQSGITEQDMINSSYTLTATKLVLDATKADFNKNVTIAGTLNGIDMTNTGTTRVTYANGWTDFSSGYGVLQLKEIAPGVILLQGMAKPGTKTDGIAIATIPAQFRPNMIHNIATNIRTTLAAPNQNEAALLQVHSNGNLHLFANNIASCVYATISVTYYLISA